MGNGHKLTLWKELTSKKMNISLHFRLWLNKQMEEGQGGGMEVEPAF